MMGLLEQLRERSY